MSNKELLSLENLEFFERTIREIKESNLQTENTSIGMFYGLVFGLLGNLWVNLLFLLLKNNTGTGEWELPLFLTITFILSGIFLLFQKEWKEDKKNKKRIEFLLEKIERSKKELKEGKKIDFETFTQYLFDDLPIWFNRNINNPYYQQNKKINIEEQ